MTATQSFKIQSILEKAVGREKATEFTEQIDEVVSDNTKALKEIFLTKEDKIDLISKIESTKSGLIKAIFWAGLIQYLAIIVSLLTLGNLIFKHSNP
jgi:ABC-type multidrug transport system fused ATPase/permease subunit